MTKFIDDFSKEVWEDTYKYYNTDNTIDDTFMRIAKSIASVESTEDLRNEWTIKFYDMLSDFKGVPGGRIISNAGANFKGVTLLNCFFSPIKNNDIDSLDNIINDLKNQAFTLKSEGGWGQNFSWIRPRGSYIKGIGVESPGAIKYMELYDKASDIITSGSGKKSTNKKAKKKIRKGAMMGIISCWHPDVIEGITAKQQQGRLSKFNISIDCTDDFMQKVMCNDIEDDSWDLIFPDTNFEKYKEFWDGDIKSWCDLGYPVKVYQTVSAKWLWNLIMESTYNRAEPGVLFLDRANDWNTVYYQPKGKIRGVNPCFSYSTEILTDEGYKQIGSLCDKEVNIINKDNIISKGRVWCSGKKEVYGYKLSNKKTIKCTKDHIFQDNQGNSFEISNMIGKRLMPFYKIKNRPTNIESFKAGFIFGDGGINRLDSSTHKGLEVNIGKNDMDVAEIFNISSVGRHYSREYYELALKYKISPATYADKVLPENVDEDFMMGLYSANGSVLSGTNRITYKTTSKVLAKQISDWLKDTYNIYSYITTTKKTRTKFENGEYECLESYDVNIGRYEDVLKFAENISFIQKYKIVKLESNIKNFSPIVKKSTFIGVEYVYDFNEPLTNWGVISGVIAHNCGEQLLPSAGVCDLGSMNLTQFINGSKFDFDKFSKYVKIMVRFLDNVNDYTNTPLPEYKEFLTNFRRIGVGVMGWGSLLIMMKIKFGTKKSDDLRDSIMKCLSKTAYETSIELAEEKGMFPYCEPEKHIEGKFIKSLDLSDFYIDKLLKNGIRNSSLISIQPTGNTGIFANIVSGGLEPIFSYEYIRTSIVNDIPDEIVELTPKWYEGEWKETSLFKFDFEGDEQILKGIYNGTTYKIDKNRGLVKEVYCKDYSVRYLESINDWNPDDDSVISALDLTADQHLNDLIGFMKYIDSSASKTINLPNDYSFDNFKDIYLKAYKSGRVKGVTTYRTGTMASVLSIQSPSDKQTDEEVILDSVKMLDSCDATMKVLRAEGRKWYMTVVWNDDKTRPFAIFVHTNNIEKTVTTHDAIDRLLILAEQKNIPLKYIDDVKEKTLSDSNAKKITRVLSLLLRHGVAIKNIVKELEKVENIFVGSFLFQIIKFLSSLIKDGEKVEAEKCVICGQESIIYQEGCKVCMSCGNSKCG